MWVEERNGRYLFFERYHDPLTMKLKKISVSFDRNTPQIRKLAAAELQQRIDHATAHAYSNNITFETLYNLYIQSQSGTVKESTLARNKITIRKCIELIGPDVIVDRASAVAVMQRFKDFNISASKTNEYLTRLKAMLRWGYQMDMHDNSRLIDKLVPVKDISRKEKVKDKYLEPAELDAVLAELNHDGTIHWYLLTKFLVLSGLRIGEAIALTKKDIGTKYIHVDKTYDITNRIITTTKTETSTRDVFIQPELEAVIKDIRKHQNLHAFAVGFRTDLFFSDDKGNFIHYDAYRKALRLASQKTIGRAVSPHITRHTHASLLMAGGANIDTISRRLGHDGSKVTKEIYLHVTQELRDADNKQLSEIKIL